MSQCLYCNHKRVYRGQLLPVSDKNLLQIKWPESGSMIAVIWDPDAYVLHWMKRRRMTERGPAKPNLCAKFTTLRPGHRYQFVMIQLPLGVSGPGVVQGLLQRPGYGQCARKRGPAVIPTSPWCMKHYAQQLPDGTAILDAVEFCVERQGGDAVIDDKRCERAACSPSDDASKVDVRASHKASLRPAQPLSQPSSQPTHVRSAHKRCRNAPTSHASYGSNASHNDSKSKSRYAVVDGIDSNDSGEGVSNDDLSDTGTDTNDTDSDDKTTDDTESNVESNSASDDDERCTAKVHTGESGRPHNNKGSVSIRRQMGGNDDSSASARDSHVLTHAERDRGKYTDSNEDSTGEDDDVHHHDSDSEEHSDGSETTDGDSSAAVDDDDDDNDYDDDDDDNDSDDDNDGGDADEDDDDSNDRSDTNDDSDDDDGDIDIGVDDDHGKYTARSEHAQQCTRGTHGMRAHAPAEIHHAAHLHSRAGTGGKPRAPASRMQTRCDGGRRRANAK